MKQGDNIIQHVKPTIRTSKQPKETHTNTIDNNTTITLWKQKGRSWGAGRPYKTYICIYVCIQVTHYNTQEHSTTQRNRRCLPQHIAITPRTPAAAPRPRGGPRSPPPRPAPSGAPRRRGAVRRSALCVHVCVYVCMCVCVYVCVYVCMCVCMYVCMCVCVYVCICVCVYVCMCVSMYLCMSVCV